MASVGIVLIYERFAAALKKKKSAVQASQQYEVQKYNLAELKSHEIKVLYLYFVVLIIVEILSLWGWS